jgi:hypothetical protein
VTVNDVKSGLKMVRIRAFIDTNLVLRLKHKYPETKDLNTSALIGWMANKLLTLEVLPNQFSMEKKKEEA